MNKLTFIENIISTLSEFNEGQKVVWKKIKDSHFDFSILEIDYLRSFLMNGALPSIYRRGRIHQITEEEAEEYKFIYHHFCPELSDKHITTIIWNDNQYCISWFESQNDLNPVFVEIIVIKVEELNILV